MASVKNELKKNGWTLKGAAEHLGISYKTLDRKMSYQTSFKDSELLELSKMTGIPFQFMKFVKMK